MKLSNKEILCSLELFKNSRINLIADFANCSPTIYGYMFKYEREPVAMQIAIESYFTSWVNSHVNIWIELEGCDGLNLFNSVFEKFLMIYISENNLDYNSSKSFLLKELMIQKSNIINKMLDKSESASVKFNELLISYEKDKALFNRELENLKNNRN